MAYSTQADVQNSCGGLERLKQLFDWDRDGTADPAVITDFIARADALMNSYFVKRYTVPLVAPVPDIVRTYSADLARLMAARRRAGLSEHEREEWDTIASTDEKQPGWLMLVAAGTVTLGVDPAPAPSAMVVDQVETALPEDRDISRCKLSGYW